MPGVLFLPTPTPQVQPPLPELFAVHSSISARSDFRHHVGHTNTVYSIYMFVVVSVYLVTVGLNFPSRWGRPLVRYAE